MNQAATKPIPLPAVGFRVGVVGSGYWLRVLGMLFRRAELAHDLVDLGPRSAKVAWVLRRGWRRFDVIHLIGGLDWRLHTVLGMAGRRVVVHWIGSDVMSLRNASDRGWPGRLQCRCAYGYTAAHIADSPDLTTELRHLGIEATVVRLLPERIEAEVQPLPRKFTVLSYWFDSPERRDFYGGDVVLQLAGEFPQVEFRVLQATGVGEVPPPNLTFLGYQRDMERVYAESSALIRLPKHDSMSAMVLEMLARGRYVIYNKPMEGCHYATGLDTARTALRELMTRSEPNTAGAAMVSREYSVAREVESLAGFYGGLSSPGMARR